MKRFHFTHSQLFKNKFETLRDIGLRYTEKGKNGDFDGHADKTVEQKGVVMRCV